MNENLSNRDPLFRKKHAGIPGNGGETAEHAKNASAHALFVNPNAHKLDDRAEQIARGNYVKYDYLSDVGNVSSTEGMDDWWDRARAVAGYDNTSAVHQLSQDGMVDSKHRMRYEGEDGFEIRTTSHTDMHRDADLLQSMGLPQTIDVPVQAIGPHGHVVQGWIRSTRLSRHTWSTSPMGISGPAGVMMAEAVCAIGEARRGEVRASVKNVGDLMEKRVLREMSAGVTLQEVQSSWQSGMAHDPVTKELFVEANNKVYIKKDVPTALGYRMIHARGKGETSAIFNATVGFGKNSKYQSGGIGTPCPDCKQFTSPTKPHMCPSGQHGSPSPENVARNEAARTAAARSLSSEDNRRRLEGQRSEPAFTKRVGRTDTPQPSAKTVKKPAQVKKPKAVFGRHVSQPDNKTTDVAARWAKDLNGPIAQVGKPFFGAKRGWTIDAGIPEAIAPFTDSTHNSFNFDETGRYHNLGIDRFQGLDSATAAKLLHSIPAAGLKDRQNNGPTLKNMLTASANSNGRVELSGHGVGPSRRDERLTADGVHIFDDSITTEKEAIAYAKNLGMTMKAHPDEVSQEEVPWRPGEKAWRLWWD